MLNQNIKSNNLSDFQSTINVIQFEYQHYFDAMIEHFINSSDASRVFSDFFEKAHRRMHEILDYNYSCVKINQFLHDIFLISLKYNYQHCDVVIPEFFYNFNAVLYYDNIKPKIVDLIECRYSDQLIIENLLEFEKERHRNNECQCGKNHKCINDEDLKSLFKMILRYFHQTNNPSIISNFKYYN